MHRRSSRRHLFHICPFFSFSSSLLRIDNLIVLLSYTSHTSLLLWLNLSSPRSPTQPHPSLDTSASATPHCRCHSYRKNKPLLSPPQTSRVRRSASIRCRVACIGHNSYDARRGGVGNMTKIRRGYMSKDFNHAKILRHYRFSLTLSMTIRSTW